MQAKQIKITDKDREAIATLIYYDYEDEQTHYEENNKPAGHVFESIKVLEKLLNKIDKTPHAKQHKKRTTSKVQR